ncbi:MAG: PTS sugar transporter subunit IIA [Candidatus Hydrogenedentes bacterium]|nr:PTS sugar transporter subunit IIA [Candidatus Hydrogenedentota bacterium]
MLLGEILREGLVKTQLEAQTKTEAIEELVDLLADAHEIPLSLRDHVVGAVMERERSMSTGMEHGVALPHGSSSQIDDIVGALGIAPHGIPFESLDGQPAQLIILLVLPKERFQAHVRTLAGIAHLLGNGEFRKALLAAPDADAVLQLIEREEEGDVFFDLRGGS